MIRKIRFSAVLAVLAFTLGAGAALAQNQDFDAVLAGVRNAAVKVVSVTGAEREAARQALFKVVGEAVSRAGSSAEIEAIMAAAVTADPPDAAAITRAAVAAAPERAVEIAAAALNGVTNPNQRSAIVNAAKGTAPRDGETVAALQSLLSRPVVSFQSNVGNPAAVDLPDHQAPPVPPSPGGGSTASPS